MRTIVVALAVGLVAGAPAHAAGGGHFQMVTTPGSPNGLASYYRLNVETGQTVAVYGANTQFVNIVDKTPIPQGDYHIEAPTWLSADGHVTWNLFRLDLNTGRSWTALGGGSAPVVWTEITPPK